MAMLSVTYSNTLHKQILTEGSDLVPGLGE